MSDFDPKVANALQELIRVLALEFPEVQVLLDQARDGLRSEADTMNELMRLAHTDPTFEKRFLQQAKEVMGPLQEADLVHVGEPSNHPMAFESGVGAPQLNPLYAAALAERLQFDGDIPEFRVGPAPLDSTPAVPVDTKVTNPVALGMMLTTASSEVADELQEGRLLLQAQVAAHDDPTGTALTVLEKHEAALVLHGSPETDPEGYRRGSLPVPRTVTAPSGAALAAMPLGQRQDASWKALSTTQGRRSGLQVVEAAVVRQLTQQGFTVEGRLFSKASKPEVGVEWVLEMSGARSHSPEFSFLDTAGAVIGTKLARMVEAGSFWVEVRTVDDLADRRIGWYGQLVRRAQE
jgi:hypothetical protein